MYLKISDIAKKYNISKTAIRNFVRDGKFPKPIRIGGCVRWSEDDINEFEQSL